MNMLELGVRQFILRALLAAGDRPMVDSTLRSVVRQAFAHVAIAESDLSKWIVATETAGLITSADDTASGTVWTLTLIGTLKAKQLK
jgi:hypothetical protein